MALAQSTAGLRLTDGFFRGGAPRLRGPARVRPEAERLRIERRGGDRSAAGGLATATFVDPDGRLWLTSVSLVDRSDSGLGVRCPVPVMAGARFSLSLEGSGSAVEGVVAHSRGVGGGCRLGLRCSRRQAA